MELLILIGYIIVAIIIFRKLEGVVYSIALADIFLRIVTFIKQNITSQEIYTFLNENIPLSIVNIIDKNTSGLLNESLIWVYVVIFALFEFYIIKALLRLKK